MLVSMLMEGQRLRLVALREASDDLRYVFITGSSLLTIVLAVFSDVVFCACTIGNILLIS